MKISEALRKTADEIERRGLARGMYYNLNTGDLSSCQVCTIGGYMAAVDLLGKTTVSGSTIDWVDSQEALTYLALTLPSSLSEIDGRTEVWERIVSWSDVLAFNKKAPEVIAHIRSVADKAENEGL